MNLVGKNVVIYGAGVSGISAYELVRDMGAKAIIYDDDPMAPRATNSVGVFAGADVIVLSPGVSKEKDFLFDAKLEAISAPNDAYWFLIFEVIVFKAIFKNVCL